MYFFAFPAFAFLRKLCGKREFQKLMSLIYRVFVILHGQAIVEIILMDNNYE